MDKKDMTDYSKLIIYSPGHIGTKSSGEYPLFDQFHLCPRAGYVGGSDNYLCKCDYPRCCPGVLMVAKLYGKQYWKNYNKAKGDK